MNAKGVILQAFEHFRLKSCIDFKPRTSEEYYLSVRGNTGCSSYVARVIKGGQVISIGKECGYLGTVEHEFLHALGFYHEQSRYDRDDYITIIWKNIRDGFERNFKKLTLNSSTSLNAPYDYLSVMHYGKDFFSKNSESTIATKLPQYQNKIGQRLEMSPIDVYKLNRLYNCSTTVSFMEYCSFSSANICGMNYCEQGLTKGWKRMSVAASGPFTDYTNLNKKGGYFMHASTASGQEGDSAWLETKRMRPTRECHVQCLQFYYYHSGSQSDQLNIWIREFQDETDSTGNLRLMEQITGRPTFAWQFYKVPLNVSKPFQIVFEVRNGNEVSSGGFSIDDINLSESECPHNVWQIPDFKTLLTTSDNNSYLFSPRMYSTEGYAYQVIIVLRKTFFGVYFHLVSGDNDSTLEWPCPWRQVTLIMLDKHPQVQQQMSKQITLTTDPSSAIFDNPHKVGTLFTMNGETYYANPDNGLNFFFSLEEISSQDFLRGDTAVFLISLTDISSLQHNSSLPCPKHPLSKFTNTYPSSYDKGPCDKRLNTKS
uniref:meprin A subunit beta-like n=1 Tax=Monopterus albus TaxID=43700 RepID=UPI0009B3DB4A|nr:meprin A subunit beta-like [Monopterus albus]